VVNDREKLISVSLAWERGNNAETNSMASQHCVTDRASSNARAIRRAVRVDDWRGIIEVGRWANAPCWRDAVLRVLAS